MRWFPVRVAGDSMLPTLRAGDFLAVRSVRAGEPRAGQIVLVRAGGLEGVKRVVRLLDDRSIWVEGDNAGASTDSRAYGSLPSSAAVGVVRLRYWPLWRLHSF